MLTIVAEADALEALTPPAPADGAEATVPWRVAPALTSLGPVALPWPAQAAAIAASAAPVKRRMTREDFMGS